MTRDEETVLQALEDAFYSSMVATKHYDGRAKGRIKNEQKAIRKALRIILDREPTESEVSRITPG